MDLVYAMDNEVQIAEGVAEDSERSANQHNKSTIAECLSAQVSNVKIDQGSTFPQMK